MATLFPLPINGFPRNIPKKTDLHKLDVVQSIVLCKDDSITTSTYPIFSSLNIQEQSRLYKSQSEHFSRQIVVKAMPEGTKTEKNTTMMTNVDSHPNVMIRCSYCVFSQIEGQRLIKWMKLRRFFFRLANYCVWSFSKILLTGVDILNLIKLRNPWPGLRKWRKS